MIVLKLLGSLVVVLAVAVFFMRRMSSVIRVERTLPAPLSKVWAIWTDAESMKNWWGPKDFTAPVIKNDFRVGGAFLLAMRSPKGETFWNTGKYTEIVPFQKIDSTFSFSDENGRAVPGKEVPVPGVWPDEVTLAIRFKESGGKTIVSVTETGIPFVMKLFAKMGWEQQFDKIEKLVQ